MPKNKKELTLQEIQKAGLKVLLKLKEIFDENGWDYYLGYGTLLGAVRHKGFIPWDDDIDIWVPRADYEKFVQYCIDNKKKLKPFELHHYKTNKKYIYPIARFSDSRYKIEYNDAEDYGLGIFVDVYPFDGYDKSDVKQNKKIQKLQNIISICGNKKMIKSGNALKNLVKIPYYKYNVFRHKKNLNKVIEKVDKIAQKHSFEDAKRVNCVAWSFEGENFLKKWIVDGKKKQLSFCGTKMSVPSDYDKVLKMQYGGYMKLPPEEERIGHHLYSAYKK